MREEKDMLDEKDIKTIHGILGEFFEKVLAPYFDAEYKENKEDHGQIRNEMRQMREELIEHVKDHETRISKLEVLTSVKN